jgi:predicted aspartyl protease
MICSKDNGMGRFSVEIEVANNHDMELASAGHLPLTQVRRTQVRGVVDTGATRLVLPGKVVEEIGAPITGTVGVRYANGQTADRDRADGIHLTCLGRSSVFNAVVEPDRDSALIGAIVLEDLDFIVDCTTQQLRPRDPRKIISEIE